MVEEEAKKREITDSSTETSELESSKSDSSENNSNPLNEQKEESASVESIAAKENDEDSGSSQQDDDKPKEQEEKEDAKSSSEESDVDDKKDTSEEQEEKEQEEPEKDDTQSSQEEADDIKEEEPEHTVKEEKIPKKPLKESISELKDKAINFYDTKYKKLLYVPFALLLVSVLFIGFTIISTGDFVKKDISLTGGISITIQKEGIVDIVDLENYLNSQFPVGDIRVRSLTKFGQPIGIIIDGTSDVNTKDVIKALSPKLGKLNEGDYSAALMGSSLGASFFKEILKAIFISFLFMGIIIFWYFGEGLKIKLITSALTITSGMLIFAGTQSIIKDVLAYIIGISLIVIYFRNSIPSFVVILNVFSDIVVTLAIINLIGLELSTAGVAAFLMIIGYSVDTNILLSTKLLKRKEGSVTQRLFDAMRTGLTMSITTSVAIIIALIFTQSSVIQQIMTILLIGLIVDMINTWLLNAPMLRIYLDKKRLH